MSSIDDIYYMYSIEYILYMFTINIVNKQKNLSSFTLAMFTNKQTIIN